MTATAKGRQVIRRAALLGAAGYGTVTGEARRLWQGNHGVAALLLHNTLDHHERALVDYVQENRDRFVDFGAVEDLIAGDMTSQATKVTITFDDGFHSNLGVARRLAELDLQACFYVPTDVIGAAQSEVDSFFGRRQVEGVLTWRDLEELVSLGHLVGSHCRQHKPLINYSDAEAEDQIKGSLSLLRHRLGSARHFAWPFGSLRHAEPTKVVTWCNEVDAVAASGVRGFNTYERFSREGYLRRDAVDLQWLKADVTAFFGRNSR